MTRRPNKAEAVNRLQAALDAIPELMVVSRRSPKFIRWHRDTNIAIRHIFGGDSEEAKEFPYRNQFEIISLGSIPEDKRQYHYQEVLGDVAPVLESMIAQVRDYWEEENEGVLLPNDSLVEAKETKNTVFIVHGRDEGAKETVARFIEKLGLAVVILHEQPNQGHTIIEKLEKYAQAGFAVVLLTPDDVGALQSQKSDLKPRARQNVVFECGYFIGKLGRERVCVLVKDNMERPSDYDGVIYIPLGDSNDWKWKLSRELKSVGFEVDANKAF